MENSRWAIVKGGELRTGSKRLPIASEGVGEVNARVHFRLRPWMLVLLMIAALGVFVTVQVLRHSTPPTDQALVERFQRDRADFEILRGMLAEDVGLSAVFVGGVRRTGKKETETPEAAGLSQARFKTYRTIFKRLKLQSALREGAELRFPVDGWGFGPDGWRLALVYRESPPSPLLANMDERSTGPGPREAFRRLETHWYAWLTW